VGYIADVVLGLESGHRYDVVVLAATRSGFPAVDESDWLWVSHRVAGSETTTRCNYVTFDTYLLLHCWVSEPQCAV